MIQQYARIEHIDDVECAERRGTYRQQGYYRSAGIALRARWGERSPRRCHRGLTGRVVQLRAVNCAKFFHENPTSAMTDRQQLSKLMALFQHQPASRQ